MLQQRIGNLVNTYGKYSQQRLINTTSAMLISQRWRKERGLSLNPNATGVLTDGPDYTFLDGRLTPYGTNQKDRIMRNKDVLKKILELTSEVDFAVERHKQLQISEENRKKEILGKKLKPKGLELLKSKKKASIL